MDKIPVSFEYKGKHYKGTLEEVNGGGGGMWHLTIDRYYCGQMNYNGNTGTLRFTSQTGKFEELNDFFADVLIAWYQ